jgi:DNA-binding response OmpR family regulator
MPKKILLIEDEPELSTMMKSRLEANHYEVITAGDGEEGLKKIEAGTPDLILLDVMLPGMDGYTFVKTLKTKQSETIPIIVVTAKGDNLRGLFELEGIKDYITKPFQGQDLLERIKKHIG